MSAVSYYSGKVHSVVYDNPDNAFYILKMVLDGDATQNPVSVKGNVPGLRIATGSWFGFEGKWDHHKSYGKQLAITRAPVLQGQWDPETAFKTLVANGVGSFLLQTVRDHFGDEGFLEALQDAKKLEEVPGITEFVAVHIASRWDAMRSHFETVEFLSSLGLPSGVIRNIWRHFQDEAQRVLATNPWALVEVEGITFEQADEVARKAGLQDPQAQARGAVLYACKSNRNFGHLFLTPMDILQMVQASIADVPMDLIMKALATLHKEGKLVIDRETCPGTTAVYEPWSYKMEKESAERLLERRRSATLQYGDEYTDKYLRSLGSVGPKTQEAVEQGPFDDTHMDRVVWTAIAEWGTQARLSLSAEQKRGIFNALTAPVSVLSGLPGTGKTTSLRAAVRILQDAGVPFLLCAPTGIAAKNLSARTGAPASTIHRAFSAKGKSDDKREATYAGVVGEAAAPGKASDGGLWGYSQEKTHPAEVVILDEASMLDQHLLFRLLDCTRPSARLVFVGDHAQLPSVGPGNVLRDLIASDVFPTVKLRQIFRQEDTSGIVYAAHSMVNGEVPDPNPDFKLLPLSSEEDVLEAVLKIGVRFFEARKNFQILSPKHNGTVGVTSLNSRLRELLNPGSPGLTEIRLGNDTIREGDRIMVTQNEYKLDIYNGDVGKIEKVDRGRKELQIKIHGDVPLYVSIPFKDVSRLIRLAYACTVHKAQGLEYDYIVMPLVTGFRHQLQRNLIYTAVTRAKKQVVLVGHREALALAVYNAKEDERRALFLNRLLKPGANGSPTA